jgi:2-iminobutanoate/2-iminopropanoate deaminase
MKQTFSAKGAAPPVGPYSPALRCGNLIFISGQIPLDSRGNLVTGDILQQTERVLYNLKAQLEATGCSMADVCKTTIFLRNMEDFAAVNEAYGQAFPEPFPARSTVEVSALPKGARIEIEAIAFLPERAP